MLQTTSLTSSLTKRIRPMLAVPGRMCRDCGQLAAEFKWDGVRAICHYADGRLRLDSRNLVDITARYPEVHPIVAQLDERSARSVILDGEIVAFSETGLPSFHALQGRMHVTDPRRARALARLVPVKYLIFDMLMLDGRWLLREPYRKRRAALDSLELQGEAWRTSHWYPGQAHDALDAARSVGLEGIILKNLESSYNPDERSADWVKVKLVLSQEFVVGGWMRGADGRGIGSLLLGYHNSPHDGRLMYAGNVGSGFSEEDRSLLLSEFRKRHRNSRPFADVTGKVGANWVEPELVVEVDFREWTPGGHVRQASYKGLRTDRDPKTVVREPG